MHLHSTRRDRTAGPWPMKVNRSHVWDERWLPPVTTMMVLSKKRERG